MLTSFIDRCQPLHQPADRLGPCGYGAAGVWQRGTALRLQLRHFGQRRTVALAVRLDHVFGAIVAVREHGHLGTDMLLTKLPPMGQRIRLVASYGLMLFCTWLLFSGALAQARINLDVEAPVTGASMAIFMRQAWCLPWRPASCC